MTTDRKDAVHSGRPSLLQQTVASLHQELGRVLIDRNSGGLTILNINESISELLTELSKAMTHVRSQLVDAKPNERMVHDLYGTASASMHGNATWFLTSAQGYVAVKYPDILRAKSQDTTWDASTNQQAGV